MFTRYETGQILAFLLLCLLNEWRLPAFHFLLIAGYSAGQSAAE
jgi:hypothetical protein